jgi:hypothetical protein
MAKIKANKKTLIRWKVYIDRARMYIGYVQFLMIIGVLIFDNLIFSIPIIFLVFIILSLFIGRLDTIFGLREEELRNSSSSNPVMREVLANLESIKTELKELKSEKNK